MKRESCNHCPCYLELIESRKEGMKKTNEKLTREKRQEMARKAWETKKK